MTRLQLEIDMKIGSGLVSRWISRERVPGLAEATYLQRRFGIAVEDWLSAREIRMAASGKMNGTEG